jgi:uncharacterized repeat protein (TIGR02543 family)
MTYQDGTVTVTSDKAATGVLIKANENGISVLKENVSINEGETPITDISAADGDKLYLWSGVDSIEPLTTVHTVETAVASTYTVTFSVSGTETPVNVNSGEKVEKPTDPTKDGYTFNGWYLGEEEYDFDTPVSGDITLTAKFTSDTASYAYVDENFDDYDNGTIIASAGNDQSAAPDSVTQGSIVYSAGYRNNGSINNSAAISSGELVISADGFATSGRGVSFAFASDANIPTVSTLDDSEVLEFSVKVKATQTFTVVGYGAISTDDLTTTTDYVNLRIILDKSADRQYQIITDTDGNILSSKVSSLTATTFSGMSFYAGSGTFNIDDLKVERKNADTGIIKAVVTDSGENNAAMNGASVTVGSLTFTTDSNGVAEIAVPNGDYTVTATKSGYEHTSQKDDVDTVDITINSDTKTAELTLQVKQYIKVPDTVTIKDGQSFISAPKTDDTATTAAFTAEVLDQYGLPMTADEYGLTWAVYPSGTTAADSDVTIDENGVVSVSKNFNSENKVEAYDVVAVAATDDRNNKVLQTIYVGNNDIIYYEDVNYAQQARSGSIALSNAITLPDISDITVNLAMYLGTDSTSNTNIAIITSGNKLVGLQLQAIIL